MTGGRGCLSSVTRRMRVHLRPVGVAGEVGDWEQDSIKKNVFSKIFQWVYEI